MARKRTSPSLPSYTLKCWGDGDILPDEAEELFADELAYSREPLPEDRDDYGKWRFACICAVADDGRILGGVHLDMGPINFGPLADDLYAVVEALRVRTEYKGKGLKTVLLGEAVKVARDAGCVHIQTEVSWNEPEDLRAFRACGFALTDLHGAGERDDYFAMRSLAE